MENREQRPRRTFTPEFKAEVVELCRAGDRSIGQVARDLDLNETTVRNWVNQADSRRRDARRSDERGARRDSAVAQRGTEAARGPRHPPASDGFLRQGDPVNVYPFIKVERAEKRNVKRACALLEVSRAAFYQWLKAIPSKRCRADVMLLDKIRSAHKDSKGTYGSPRVHAQLRNNGEVCGKNRIARLMQVNGIVGKAPRRFKRTSIPGAASNAVDLVKRVFGPGTIEVNRLWCGDISFIRTWEGWLYLATVIDVASRRVVGWAMADHMRTELVTDALQMALDKRRPAIGLIFHSDRGCQYTSGEFGALLDANKITQSLSRPGQCWDNAVAESFFATLKTELIYGHAWPTRAFARRGIFEFIEGWYNLNRLHSSLGYMSPADYERSRAILDVTTEEAA